MKILVIPDVHLKPQMFKQATALMHQGIADRAVCLMDIPDDWDKQYNVGLYEETYDEAVRFAKAFPETAWCYGNHDLSYLWHCLESGYSSMASMTVQRKLLDLREAVPEDNPIKYNDIANGPGVRTSIFVSGCTHHCKGCFNEIAWDFNYGTPFTDATISDIINSMKPDYIAGLTLLGGEPFEPANQRGLIPLLKAVKENYPAKDIWCFTGYLFDEDIMDKMYDKYPETREMLSYIDVCVDGRFVEELKDMMLKFKGSSNQRTILVQQSLKEGTVVTAEEYQ